MTTLSLPASLHLSADTPLAEVQAHLRPLGLEISPVRRPRVLDVRPVRQPVGWVERSETQRSGHVAL